MDRIACCVTSGSERSLFERRALVETFDSAPNDQHPRRVDLGLTVDERCGLRLLEMARTLLAPRYSGAASMITYAIAEVMEGTGEAESLEGKSF